MPIPHHFPNTDKSLGTEHSKTCPWPISWAIISGLAASGGMQTKGQSAFAIPCSSQLMPALSHPSTSLQPSAFLSEAKA